MLNTNSRGGPVIGVEVQLTIQIDDRHEVVSFLTPAPQRDKSEVLRKVTRRAERRDRELIISSPC